MSSSLIRTLHVQPNAGQTITLKFNFTSLITEVRKIILLFYYIIYMLNFKYIYINIKL